MKTNIWVLVGAVIAVVAIEEARMQSLRSRLEAAETASSEPTAVDGASIGAARAGVANSDLSTTPAKLATREATPDHEEAVDDAGDMGTTLRKMSENPVSRSMMAQGVKAMAALWYADLIDTFGLTKEEADYFIGLKADMLAGQQQLAMKLMGAKDDEERKAIMDEMKAQEKESVNAIKTFLNHDEDFATFQAYEKRLPERQQLEGLRGAMNGAGAPLEDSQESALVDAMYEARTNFKGTDWNGPDGMEALASPDVKERFEQDWDAQSTLINEKVSDILTEDQFTAFQDYREQMKEMQLMGLEMASKMFQKSEK